MVLAQSGGQLVGDPVLSFVVFLAFVGVSLLIIYRVSQRTRTRADYYVAGSAFTGPQNGVALSGDYLSAATFLGITGAVALAGPDGFLYAMAAFVAWLVALLFVAELLRNTGRFTMADVLSSRLQQRPVRAAAATSTLVICAIYLLGQMAAAGGLVALLLHVTSDAGKALVIVATGALMIVYVLFGGMTGTTWVQIIKALLMIAIGAAMAAYVLGAYGLNFSGLLAAANANHPADLLSPGILWSQGAWSELDAISLAIGGVLGVAGLPHVLMRFYTVPTAREARRSVVWAIWLIGAFFLVVLVLGYGATALVGAKAIATAPGEENSAVLLLANAVGGTVLLALVAAIVFATILAVVAGLTITSAAAFAHDIYANVLKRGQVSGDKEVRVARRAVVGIGVVSVAGGILALGQNIAFLAALGFAAAASSNLPVILYTLFWKRFNTGGALASLYGGLSVTLFLIIFSPAVSGTPASMLPGVDFSFFPLRNPGIVSVPAGFLLGYLGTVFSSERADEAKYDEMEVRSLTGAGVARAGAESNPRPDTP